jgi:hypothetical protein
MANQLVDNQKIAGGIVTTPGVNTTAWYQREPDNRFSVNGSFINLQTLFDWVIIKTTDSRFFKSGVVKLCGNKKTLVVDFETPFPSSDYFVFFTSNNNINRYWVNKKPFKFAISASFDIGSEMSWMAIHKELAVMTGINNPGSIFSGRRTIIGDLPLQQDTNGDDIECLDILDDSNANLNQWYNGQLIIKPTNALDGFYQNMNLSDYSVILSTNTNINTFWLEKATDRVKIGSSFPAACTIDYFIIKSGLNWWNEL